MPLRLIISVSLLCSERSDARLRSFTELRLHSLIKFLLFRKTLSHSSSIRKVCILSQHGAYGTDLNPLNPRGAWATLSCQVLASISILLSIHNCFARRISFLRLQIVIFVSRTLFSSVFSCSEHRVRVLATVTGVTSELRLSSEPQDSQGIALTKVARTVRNLGESIVTLSIDTYKATVPSRRLTVLNGTSEARKSVSFCSVIFLFTRALQ